MQVTALGYLPEVYIAVAIRKVQRHPSEASLQISWSSNHCDLVCNDLPTNSVSDRWVRNSDDVAAVRGLTDGAISFAISFGNLVDSLSITWSQSSRRRSQIKHS